MSRHANSLDWRNMSGEALVTLLTTPGTAAALGRLNAAGRLDPGSDMASLADAVQRIVENQRWAREHRFSLPDSAAQAAADSGETAPTVSQGCLRDLMLDRINGHAPFDVAVTQVVHSDRYLAELDSRPGQRPALHLWAVNIGPSRWVPGARARPRIAARPHCTGLEKSVWPARLLHSEAPRTWAWISGVCGCAGV